MPKVSINAKAPDFQLTEFNGNEVRLSDFQGKSNVVLIFNRGFV